MMPVNLSGKLPLQSKKFVAFLIAEITWKILAGIVLFWGKGSMDNNTFLVILVIVVTAGVVEIGYILGQAALDKYLHVAIVAIKKGEDGDG